MKFFTAFLTLFFLTSTALRAEQVFILFDGTCGDRVLYEQAVAQQPRMDYYAYHFPLTGGDRLIFETGAEGATVQNYLPQGHLYCGNPMLNVEMVNRINSGADKVFILLPTNNNQYLIQPVVMAAAFQRRGNAFSYTSPMTGFQFDTDNGIIGVNLAYNNPGAKVYFEGRDNSPCTGYFLFRQLKPNSSYPVVDYRFAPEIGMVERRLGSDGVNTTGGVVVARQVNGIPVANYLASICAASTAMASGQPLPQAGQQPPVQTPNAPQGGAISTYGSQPVYTPPTIPVQPESAAANNTPVSTTTVAHTVAKGETLYAISRRYNTTVDALRASNALPGNTVFPGQRLTITTTQAVAQNNPTSNPNVAVLGTPGQASVPTIPYNAGNVANSNPGAAQPTPYQTGGQQPYAYGQDARSGTSVYGEDIHVVQPGETVASLALKYGYTSAKFREINELGPNDVVRVGEQLKTTSCNCPAPAPAPVTSGQPTPNGYGTAPATPQPYGTAPTTQPAGQQPVNPNPYYGQPAPAAVPQAQPTGVPVNNGSVPTYTPPTEQTQPAPSINNNPNFGQVVPGATAPPTSTMGELESRGQTPPATQNPSTYGSSPASSVPNYAPASPPAYTPAAPATYGSTPASPSAYGTPVNAPNAGQPAAQPSNRSFHVVQEGETPYAIARRYGLTTARLRELNGLKATDVIVPFQKLYVN